MNHSQLENSSIDHERYCCRNFVNRNNVPEYHQLSHQTKGSAETKLFDFSNCENELPLPLRKFWWNDRWFAFGKASKKTRCSDNCSPFEVSQEAITQQDPLAASPDVAKFFGREQFIPRL
jgi:hypothetical protein